MKIVLSIDGGGIRGIVPVAILDYIERKVNEIQGDNRVRIGSLIDLIAGTSTGSIIGALMMLPDPLIHNKPKYSMKEIESLYVQMGPNVFKKKIWHNIKTLWGLFGPKFMTSNIETPLIQMFDHYKLKHLVTSCLFTGYDIDKRRVNIYTNHDPSEKYGDYYIKDIIKGSSSIPAYFSPTFFQEGLDINTIIDGGVFANNPTMIAFIEASKMWAIDTNLKKLDPHKILFISLGTGMPKRKSFSYKKSKGWGIFRWLMPILDILLSGSSDIVDYEMKKLFASYGRPDNYIRINPPLNFSTALPIDASKENITNLLKDAHAYIEENKCMLNILARQICDLKFLINFNEEESELYEDE